MRFPAPRMGLICRSPSGFDGTARECHACPIPRGPSYRLRDSLLVRRLPQPESGADRSQDSEETAALKRDTKTVAEAANGRSRQPKVRGSEHRVENHSCYGW